MLQKNDFIELEYIGKVKDNSIFDTNIKEEAKKINLDIETRHLIICLGQNMILPAIDEFLIGKALGKYILELSPEKAFGLRNRELLKVMPVKIFLEKQIMPQQGMIFQFDNLLGKVTAVSGGRVIVDFNNPLAGKIVIYDLNAKRKIEQQDEKINALMLAFFGKKLDFKLEENKIIFRVEKNFKQLIEFFKEKFKEILNLDLETEQLAEESEKSEEPAEKTEKAKEKSSLLEEKQESSPEKA